LDPSDAKNLAVEAIAPRRPARHKTVFLILLVLFPIAVALDIPLSTWAHNSGLSAWMKAKQHHFLVNDVLRFYGVFTFTLAAAIYLLLRDLLQPKDATRFGKDSALVLLSGIFSGANVPIKWIVGRVRPYHGVPPFELHPFSSLVAMNSQLSLSFPSGDVSLAFAMAASMTMVAPRVRPLWYILGVWTALERIAEGAHYPSDTVGGAALGIAAAILARKVIDKLWSLRKESLADAK
jgi:membrane-associated phospholipid phosphatase